MGHWTEATFVETPEVIGASMLQAVGRTPGQITDLLELLDDHDIDPDNVLDVACGIGRHSIELATRGMQVEGIDLSADYIETARTRARRAGLSNRTTFTVSDMRELDSLHNRLDIVLNWFAFGYFDDSINEEIAGRYHELVDDDGALVMGLNNKHAMVGEYRDSEVRSCDELLKIERREYDPVSGRINAEITKFRPTDDGYDYIGEVTWNARLYTPAEIRRMLERAGFTDVSLYGSLDGTELTRDSGLLVMVAEP